jgi:hypothetical protein
LSTLLVLIAAAIMVGLIAAGLFDPKPVGRLSSEIPLYQVYVGRKEGNSLWLDQTAPGANYSVFLSGALSSGELDSAYGLVLGTEEQNLVAAVSPTGYVSLWNQGLDQADDIIAWRTWPHINRKFGTNELWLDVVGDQLVSVRTNREILWQGEQPLTGRRIGLWAQSFADPATIDFQHLQIFSEPVRD